MYPSLPLGICGGRETFDIFPDMADVNISPATFRLSNAEIFGSALGGMVQEFTVDLHKGKKRPHCYLIL